LRDRRAARASPGAQRRLREGGDAVGRAPPGAARRDGGSRPEGRGRADLAGVAANQLASRGGHVVFWSLAAAVFVLDRVTKGLVMANVPVGEEVPAIDHLVWIAHTQNSCAAFGQGCTLAFLF